MKPLSPRQTKTAQNNATSDRKLTTPRMDVKPGKAVSSGCKVNDGYSRNSAGKVTG